MSERELYYQSVLVGWLWVFFKQPRKLEVENCLALWNADSRANLMYF